jgi:hypothetical protein
MGGGQFDRLNVLVMLEQLSLLRLFITLLLFEEELVEERDVLGVEGFELVGSLINGKVGSP